MWRNICYRQNRPSITSILCGAAARITSFDICDYGLQQCMQAICLPNQGKENRLYINQTSSYHEEKSQFNGEFEGVKAKQCDASLSFAKHLLLNETNKDKNVVVSPLSIQVVLSLIANGSKGDTLRQLLSFLKVNSVDDLNSFNSRLCKVVFAGGGDCLSVVNGIWLDQSLIIKPSFKWIVDSIYKATLSHVDFKNKVDSYLHYATINQLSIIIDCGCNFNFKYFSDLISWILF